MADKELQSRVTYDFTKNITGLEINPAYIHGLERITNKMIIENSDRGSELPGIFAKFDKIVAQAKLPLEEQEQILLDEFESDIYTLFSLIQLFKYMAREQKLDIKTETTATKQELADLAKMIEKGADVSEKIKEINAKMTIVK
tara:strand:- start:3973 stop:4401 length:429 start_codon:yes stop_codon:yes gene_type:complete